MVMLHGIGSKSDPCDINDTMYLVVSLLVIINAGGNLGYTNELSESENSTAVHLEYVLLGEENPCARPCISGAAPMICRYTFTVEWYHTLSKACYDCPFNATDCFREDCIPADGYKRPVISINRRMPGPIIELMAQIAFRP
ncbi:hypothetical protein NQ318_000402 [Aromia moschata]|uniref:Uncharacterized protein n=1 Tax=Aromia moschata TaxID=1265417 RepID=A0AAV8YT72_9CUCU|nr:hypothetical protein NQ318_000402 [Aromia moschata]